MSMWSIVVPETADITNLVANPSVERATTGYTGVLSATLTRLGGTDYARRGAYGIRLVLAADTYSGVYYGTVSLTSGTTYTFSVYVKGVNGIPYRIYFGDGSGNVLGTPATFTGTGEWQRVSVSYTEVSTTTRRVYFTKNNSANTQLVYLDGFMVTGTSYLLEYFDGDSDGAEWDGAVHASTSKMDAQYRGSGRVYDFDTYSVTVRAERGIGVLDAEHLVLDQALLPGALFKGRKPNPRVVELLIQAKGSDWSGLHDLRKDLWDAIKPHRTKGDQAFILRYSGANADRPVDLYVVYDSGLEMGNPDMYMDEFNLRMIAYDPYWYDAYNGSLDMTGTSHLKTYRYYASKIDGEWSSITPSAVTDPGSGISVRAIVEDRINGKIYVGGLFLNWDGIANADYIAYYDIAAGTWNAMGTGMNGKVSGIALAADGTLYACGDFTTAGGGAAAYVAYWNGSAWSALGSGLGLGGNELAIAPDGSLYVVGTFTTAGGGGANRIAKWDGSAWSALGTGFNNEAYDLVIASNGYIYVTGQFTTADGNTANRTAYWDGSAWNAMGSGMGTTVGFAIAMGPDGIIYVGGNFTTADGNTVNKIAAWNGAGWYALGSGVSGGDVYDIQVDEDGLVYIGGSFTSASGLTLADRGAIWNGSTFTHLDINLPGSATIYVIFSSKQNLYLGFDTSGSATRSYQHTVTYTGSEIGYPIARFRWESGGTGVRITYLKNEITGATIWLNYNLLMGEELILDFRPDNRSARSSFYGNQRWGGVLRGSDLGEFYLLPGTNTISVFVEETSNPVHYYEFIWTPVHDSADGAAA